MFFSQFWSPEGWPSLQRLGKNTLNLPCLFKLLEFLVLWQHHLQSLPLPSHAWVSSYFIHEWVSEGCSVMSNSLRPHGLYSPWNSSGQNTGVSSLSLLLGIFPTQGSNLGLPHCKQILYQEESSLRHKWSPGWLPFYMVVYMRGEGNGNPLQYSCL